jgi:hypothetical protein
MPVKSSPDYRTTSRFFPFTPALWAALSLPARTYRIPTVARPGPSGCGCKYGRFRISESCLPRQLHKSVWQVPGVRSCRAVWRENLG